MLLPVKFQVAAARLHPLYGLYLTGLDGVEYDAQTKASLLVSGLVCLNRPDGGWHPYRAWIPEDNPYGLDPAEIHGTDDPVALEIALLVDDERHPPFENDNGWVHLPVPTTSELTSRWA